MGFFSLLLKFSQNWNTLLCDLSILIKEKTQECICGTKGYLASPLQLPSHGVISLRCFRQQPSFTLTLSFPSYLFNSNNLKANRGKSLVLTLHCKTKKGFPRSSYLLLPIPFTSVLRPLAIFGESTVLIIPCQQPQLKRVRAPCPELRKKISWHSGTGTL